MPYGTLGFYKGKGLWQQGSVLTRTFVAPEGIFGARLFHFRATLATRRQWSAITRFWASQRSTTTQIRSMVFGIPAAQNHAKSVVFGIPGAQNHANRVVFGISGAQNHADNMVFGIPTAQNHANRVVFGIPRHTQIVARGRRREDAMQTRSAHRASLGNPFFANLCLSIVA